MANGVYWTGADGQTYIRTEGMAQADRWRAPMLSPQQMGLTLIDDPVNPRNTSSAPTGGSGGTANAPLNQAGINNTQLTLDQLPGLLEAALQAERQRYGNTVNEFNSQEQGQRKTYDESTTTNQPFYPVVLASE